MTEIQNNLFGIKWPTGVDMPLNKTQTQTYLTSFSLFSDCSDVYFMLLYLSLFINEWQCDHNFMCIFYFIIFWCHFIICLA